MPHLPQADSMSTVNEHRRASLETRIRLCKSTAEYYRWQNDNLREACMIMRQYDRITRVLVGTVLIKTPAHIIQLSTQLQQHTNLSTL